MKPIPLVSSATPQDLVGVINQLIVTLNAMNSVSLPTVYAPGDPTLPGVSGSAGLTDGSLFQGTPPVGWVVGTYPSGTANTSFGDQAMPSLTTGYRNSAFGNVAGMSLTTGANNTFIGQGAGWNALDVSQSTFIGTDAGNQNLHGLKNTIIGCEANEYNLGSSCTVIGQGAGANQSTQYTADSNTIVGALACLHNTGAQNVVIGANAGLGVAATSTYANTVIVGFNAGQALTTGLSNTLIGDKAGAALTSGAGVTAVGEKAGLTSTINGSSVYVGAFAGQLVDSYSNVMVGYSAGTGATGSTYHNCTALGYQAGTALTAGNLNTLIGYNAGSAITTGSNNTIIGGQVPGSTTLANAIILADGAGNIRYDYGNTVGGQHTFSGGVIKTITSTVATLPAAATAGAGARSMVTDGSVVATGNFGTIIAGAGANIVPVFCDGTNWRIG